MKIFKKAFTLAEIMVVLLLIGVLSAILLPVAFNSTPDENVMKFKKGHNTLYTVIRTLVTSDKYYLDGDLGIKADGTLIDSNENIENAKYFCKTFADVVTTKKISCSDVETEAVYSTTDAKYHPAGAVLTTIVDDNCANYLNAGEEIVLQDGVVIYQTCPFYSFGITHAWVHGYSSNTDKRPFADYFDDDGFVPIYKIICMDVDGIHPNATPGNCVNECPFGYGIRADGKILNGARATEWLKKGLNKE